MKSKHVSKRTKDVKKRAVIFYLISLFMMIGVVCFVVVSTFSKVGGSDKTGADILSDTLKAQIISLSVTAIICLLLIFIIKDKIRLVNYNLPLAAGANIG